MTQKPQNREVDCDRFDHASAHSLLSGSMVPDPSSLPRCGTRSYRRHHGERGLKVRIRAPRRRTRRLGWLSAACRGPVGIHYSFARARGVGAMKTPHQQRNGENEVGYGKPPKHTRFPTTLAPVANGVRLSMRASCWRSSPPRARASRASGPARGGGRLRWQATDRSVVQQPSRVPRDDDHAAGDQLRAVRSFAARNVCR
jgi:hypothetical protein